MVTRAELRTRLGRLPTFAGVVMCGSILLQHVALARVYDSGGTGESERLVRHAVQADLLGHYTEAIALDSKALAVSPDWGLAYQARAAHFIDAGLYAQAETDLNRVVAMHPDSMVLHLMRAQIELRKRNSAGAITQLQEAVGMPGRSFWHQPAESPGHDELGNGILHEANWHVVSYTYLYRSIAQVILHHPELAMDDMRRMEQMEYEYPAHILVSYCREAELAGMAELAELACQRSLESNSHDIGQYDSLGFAHLLMAKWDDAIKDYNRAIDDKPDHALSLYGRGIAKRHKGDLAGGNADIAAAQEAEPDIANIMHRLGAPAP